MADPKCEFNSGVEDRSGAAIWWNMYDENPDWMLVSFHFEGGGCEGCGEEFPEGTLMEVTEYASNYNPHDRSGNAISLDYHCGGLVLP